MQKRLSIVLFSLLCLTIVFSFAEGAEITICAFDKDEYAQGQTGYLSVTVYNDKEDKIRVMELTAAIDYYYTDDNVYAQTFFTSETLPVEIQRGETAVFEIPFSLPTNVAPGYTSLFVRAKTELWNIHAEAWGGSEYPTFQPTLYIESPFKQQLEEQQLINENLQNQLLEVQAINSSTTTMMYLMGATAIIFVLVSVFLLLLSRRARALPQPMV